MKNAGPFPLLEQIDTPSDLRRLPDTSLEALALEFRSFLIAGTSHSGGHFAAGLGIVELTIAVHPHWPARCRWQTPVSGS